MAVALDTHTATGSFSTTNTGTVTLSTTGAGNIVFVSCHCEQTSSVTWNTPTSAHLTFASQKSIAWTDTTGNTKHNNLKVFWAFSSGTLTNEVITCTTSASIDDASMLGFSTTGQFSNTAPFDSNSSNWAIASNTTNTTSVPACTISTSQANTMIVCVCAETYLGLPTANVAGGWTLIASKSNAGGTDESEQAAQYQNFTTQQTNLSAAWAAPGIGDWGNMVFAITSDNNSPLVQAFNMPMAGL